MGREATDRDALDGILKNLHLEIFYDQEFAQSVKQTIQNMYDAPYIFVNGQRIGNEAVRARLKLLSIGHIDYIEKQLDEHGAEVISGERYLAACIYNAPVDCMVKMAGAKNAW